MTFISAIAVFVIWAWVLIIVYEWICSFSERTPNDVPPFLQKIDLETLNGVFHPETEEAFRQKNSTEDFKRIQWKRVHLAIHFCKNLGSNSRVIQGLTRYQRKRNWNALGPELRQVVFDLRMVCMQCRMAAFLIRLRLQWWLLRMSLLPWMPPPSFRTLLRMGSADMICFYEQILTNAETFSLACGEDYHQRLMQAL